MDKKLFSRVDQAPYGQKYLNPASMSSYQFLQDCTYNVDLKKLYRLKSTCYFNNQMPFCPVLVQLERDMKEFYPGYNYLLQVWDTSNNKIYERPLKSDLAMWNIFFNYLIFKPSEPDQGHDTFFIVNLAKRNATIQVLDFTKFEARYRDVKYQFIAYENNVLYVATQDHIKLLYVPDDMQGDEDEAPQLVQPDESEVSAIMLDHGVLIHGFYINERMTAQKQPENRREANSCILVALETDQNLIDLNTLHLLTAAGAENFDYQFRQYRPIIPQKTSGFDRISKFQLVFHEDGISSAVALRRSGQVDFYHDGMLCLSKNAEVDSQYKVDLAEISFDETFIQTTYIGDDPKKKQEEGTTVIRGVNHDLLYTQSIGQARIIKDYKMNNVFYQRIKNHCKIFTGFVFLKTYIFVAHGCILSLYDILKQKFTRHLKFNGEIDQVFRSSSSSSDGSNQEFMICVLLENEELHFLTRRNGGRDQKDEDVYEEEPRLADNLYGKIKQFDQDRDDNAWTFILVEQSNQAYSLQCLHDCKLQDITELFKNQNITITEETNFVFLFSPKSVTEVLVHNGDKFHIFEIIFNEGYEQIEIIPRETRDNVWVNKSLPEEEQVEEPFVVKDSELHSAIRVKDKNGLFILADHTYFYVINMSNNNEPTRFKQMCAGLYLSDDNYMYALCHKIPETKTGSGFRLFDIENCISQVWNKSQALLKAKINKGVAIEDGEVLADDNNSDELMSYLLQPVQVGCQCLIDFSHQNQRLVYQSSYDQIDVVPVLHRNTISFVGMSNRSEYLATKVIKDRFIALSNKNLLTSWFTVTGKMANEYHLSEIDGYQCSQDYSNFEIYNYSAKHVAYHQDWASSVLLKSKKVVDEEIDDAQFYDPRIIESKMDHQVSFIKKRKKILYEFKLIEIESENELIEHFSFLFPYYGGAEQHMYFSSDKKYMFERVAGDRSFMYERQAAPTKESPYRVIWIQKLRFSQFPSDLVECTQYPYIFSPDFTQYLDIDRKAKKFLIKDTFSRAPLHQAQGTRLIIPEHVMSCRQESHIDVASRCVWIDDNTLKYVTRDGIERKIDVPKRGRKKVPIEGGEFKELEFNVVPMFDQMHQQQLQGKRHIYIEKRDMAINDTLNRLKTKYLAYKSNYYLEGKRGQEIYPHIFTVDYNISNYKERYVADLSFSFLHWNLMEKLESGLITISQIDTNQFEKLIYNILPCGNTVFHRLAEKKGTIIVEILKNCHPNPDKAVIPMPQIHIPFLENFAGSNPIKMLMKEEGQQDQKTINWMLLYLSGYGIDHHSRSIADQLPQIVSYQCQNLNIYLQSRLIKTKACKEVTKGNLLEEDLDPPGVAVCASKYCISQETQKIIKSNDGGVQSDLNLQFFDVAKLYQYDSDLPNEFFKYLAQTEDMSLFDNLGIKMLIEFRWPLVKEYVVKRLFIPFVAFLMNFSFYMSTIYELRQEDNVFYQFLNYFFMGLLFLQSLYFIGIEMYQLSKNGSEYFTSVWNYLDLTPPILLMVFLPLAFVGTFDSINGEKQNQTLEASLQATTSLFLWLKFLYFLRIFKSTGYLIKIIIAVCVDMRYFLLILFLTIMAFGDSLRAMSTSNLPQNVYIESWWQSFAYVYRMILGDFSTEETVLEGGPVLQDTYSSPNAGLGKLAPYFTWGIFYLCTVLNMIIMLNLLIAIISDSFQKINVQKQQASYQEVCDIIAENTYLVPAARRTSFTEANRFLLIAVDIQQDFDNQPRDSNALLRETYKKITDANAAMEKKIIEHVNKQNSNGQAALEAKMEKIMKENAQIMEMLRDVIDPRRNQED